MSVESSPPPQEKERDVRRIVGSVIALLILAGAAYWGIPFVMNLMNPQWELVVECDGNGTLQEFTLSKRYVRIQWETTIVWGDCEMYLIDRTSFQEIWLRTVSTSGDDEFELAESLRGHAFSLDCSTSEPSAWTVKVYQRD